MAAGEVVLARAGCRRCARASSSWARWICWARSASSSCERGPPRAPRARPASSASARRRLLAGGPRRRSRTSVTSVPASACSAASCSATSAAAACGSARSASPSPQLLGGARGASSRSVPEPRRSSPSCSAASACSAVAGGRRSAAAPAERVELAGAVPGLLQRGDLGAQLGDLGARGLLAQRVGALAHRLDAGAGLLGLALELVQAAALVAGQALGLGALDGDGGELLADGVGAALDLLDALERGGELGAGGLALALALALQPLERLGELWRAAWAASSCSARTLLELGDRRRLPARRRRCELSSRRARLGGARRRRRGARSSRPPRPARPRPRRRRRGPRSPRRPGAVGARAGRGGRRAARGRPRRPRARQRGRRPRRAGRAPGAPGGRAARVAVELGRHAGSARCEVGAQRVGLALGGLGAARLLGLAARLVELRGQAAGDALELVDALQRATAGARRPRRRRRGRGRAALDARVGVGEALLGLGVLLRRARPRGGRAPPRPTGSGSSGRKTTSVPAVRQPSHGCASGSIAWRSARTTTGCCWRMRSSIRFSGSSKQRSSRKSEKSKPSSSLTGTKTASIGNVAAVGVRRPIELDACPGRAAARRASRNSRQAWPAGGSAPPISVVEEALAEDLLARGWSNSSSAGSDHLETEPWPSVRTK